MAYYITPDNEVREWRLAPGLGGNAIQFEDDGTVLRRPNTHRMFAVHPEKNENLKLVDGVWLYKGLPIEGD